MGRPAPPGRVGIGEETDDSNPRGPVVARMVAGRRTISHGGGCSHAQAQCLPGPDRRIDGRNGFGLQHPGDDLTGTARQCPRQGIGRTGRELTSDLVVRDPIEPADGVSAGSMPSTRARIRPARTSRLVPIRGSPPGTGFFGMGRSCDRANAACPGPEAALNLVPAMNKSGRLRHSSRSRVLRTLQTTARQAVHGRCERRRRRAAPGGRRLWTQAPCPRRPSHRRHRLRQCWRSENRHRVHGW